MTFFDPCSQQHPNSESESNQQVPLVENEDLQQLGSKVNSEHTDSSQQSKEDVINDGGGDSPVSNDELPDYDNEAERVVQEHRLNQESPSNDTRQDSLSSSTIMDQLHSDDVIDDSSEEDVTDMTDRQDDSEIVFIQHPEVDSQDDEVRSEKRRLHWIWIKRYPNSLGRLAVWGPMRRYTTTL